MREELVMDRKKIRQEKKILCLALSLLLLLGGGIQVYAETTKEKISNAREEQQETRSSLQITREKIQELETKKGESEVYLADLNTQLETLRAELEQLQADYDAKQAELEQLQEELEIAKADEEQQYEAMKIRIRYMYENSVNDYYELIFSSDSIAGFLNQAENISKITEYDRNMLQTYRETKEKIEITEQAVQKEKDEIAELQVQSLDKQEAVQELVQVTYNQIRTYQADIENQESNENALLTKISEQEEAINSLIKQAKEEEARIAAQKKAEEEAAKAAAEQAAKEAAEKAASQSSGSSASSGKSSSSSGSAGSSNSGSTGSSASGNAGGSGSGSTGASNAGSTSSSGSTGSASSGTADASSGSSNDSASSSGGTYLGKFKLTAYCACSKCCGKWAGGGTASGTTPTPGRTVAMAGVPFGTKLLINGHVYTVEDRGTAYGHVDVFMGSHSEALAFGLKYAEVYQVG